jgi:maltose alpha-D-glucosyltransferase/alpha-amylase
VVNLSKYAQPAELDLRHYKGYVPVEMFSKNRFPVIKEDSFYFFPMSPHTFQWFILEKAHTDTEDAKTYHTLDISELTDLLQNNHRHQFETKVLPEFMQRKKWFQGKHRNVYAMTVAAHMHLALTDCNNLLMLVEVSYESGLPEYYQLAMTLLKGPSGRRFTENYPEAVLAYTSPNGEYGIIVDAFFTSELQAYLFDKLSSEEAVKNGKSSLHFNAAPMLREYVNKQPSVTSTMHSNDINNTSLTYDNTWFLKMYRKVDTGMNPDVELSQELSNNAAFPNIPKFVGTIEWRMEKGTVVLGMMQSMIENHGDGRSYMLERLHNYIERIEARDKSVLQPYLLLGSLSTPLAFEDLPEDLQTLLGNRAAEQARLIGQRTGELHLALATMNTTKEFQPEPFSLHYQRSLFSSMQSLVRESFHHIDKKWESLPELTQSSLEGLRDQREIILTRLKRIYEKKLDVMRIRIHSTYELRKVLLTGKDLSIQDFVGDPLRSFSERRIKRSPVRDIADMVCSFYYVAYEGFFSSQQVPKDQIPSLLPFARQWAYYMSGFFTKAWLDVVKGKAELVPEEEKDFDMLVQTFILERAIRYLNYELVHRPDWALVPIHIIKHILQNKEVANR